MEKTFVFDRIPLNLKTEDKPEVFLGAHKNKRNWVSRLVLCLFFFLISPVCLGLSFWFFNSGDQKVLGEKVDFPLTVMSSSENQYLLMSASVNIQNGSQIMIERYLQRYGSPLLPYSGKIVEEAEKNKIDPYLIVAIAQQESNLGKNSLEGCYNAWGWGIHSRGTLCFDSWEKAIETVSRGIARDYCAKGYCDDPCLMMKKYTPRSNGSWCFGVNQFLSQLRTGDF